MTKKIKLKTKKSLAKRIKITATGKWIHQQSNTSHLSRSKSKGQKRRLDRTKLVDKVDQRRLKKLLNN